MLRNRLVPLLLGLSLAGCSQPAAVAPADDDYGAIADFALTERSEKKVELADLKGKVWVASFIFTSCAGPCSHISGSMAKLQHDLADLDNFRLVSFTVFPDYDTPKVLRAYATRYSADPDQWLFLTGPREKIYELIISSFKVGVERTPNAESKPGNEVTHSTKLVLVDRRGRHRGFFEGTDPAALEKLESRVKALLKESP